MKKTVIKTAKNKEKAISDALNEINKREDEVEIEILEEESSGFLGLIGQKDAVVRITYDDSESSFDDLVKDIDSNIKEQLSEIKENINKETTEIEEEVEKTEEEIVENKDIKNDDKKEDNSLTAEEETPEIDKVEKYYRAKDFLKEILENMHFEDPKVIGNLEDNIIKLDAKINDNDTGIAIGREGKTLDAIELIMRKSLKTRSQNLKINIDINNYKKRRDDRIVEQVDAAARKVLKTRKKWNLKYMNSYERRLAHEQISKYENLTSFSEGVEPKRYVVVDLVRE